MTLCCLDQLHLLSGERLIPYLSYLIVVHPVWSVSSDFGVSAIQGTEFLILHTQNQQVNMWGMCGAFLRSFLKMKSSFTQSGGGAEWLAPSSLSGKVAGSSPGQAFQGEVCSTRACSFLLAILFPCLTSTMCLTLMQDLPVLHDRVCLTCSYSSYTDDSPTTRTTSYTISSSRPR